MPTRTLLHRDPESRVEVRRVVNGPNDETKCAGCTTAILGGATFLELAVPDGADDEYYGLGNYPLAFHGGRDELVPYLLGFATKWTVYGHPGIDEKSRKVVELASRLKKELPNDR